MRLRERGFTFIELLVVVVILGILAAVVVFAVSGGNTDPNFRCIGPNGVYDSPYGQNHQPTVIKNDDNCPQGPG